MSSNERSLTRQLGHLTLVSLIALPVAAAAQELAPALTSPGPSTCIAFVLPSVQGVEGDATAVGTSLRELFASFLRGPSMQVVLLEARLAAHAVEEARLKDCAHVLSVMVTRRRAGSGGSTFGQIVGQAGSSAAWGLPMGGVGAAVARGATVATTQAISELAASTRSRDEIRLDYRVTSLDGRITVGPRMDRAKAKSDGEDLLTPMVERAAEAIAAASK